MKMENKGVSVYTVLLFGFKNKEKLWSKFQITKTKFQILRVHINYPTQRPHSPYLCSKKDVPKKKTLRQNWKRYATKLGASPLKLAYLLQPVAVVLLFVVKYSGSWRLVATF